MSDTRPKDTDGGLTDGSGMVRRQIRPDPETSEYDLLEILAEVEGCEIEDLPPLYNDVEHFVETLFRTPPSAAAQMSMSFSYAGYRITLDRSGIVHIILVKDTL